jgi:uncharacterized protein YfaQ (DUF2300 family)
LSSLAECFGVRKMTAARREIERLLKRKNAKGQPLTLGPGLSDPPADSLPWSAADRLAVHQLHLGDPEAARRTWNQAQAPASSALRLTRLAEADLAALDSEAALRGSRSALKLDAALGEAWYVLTVANLESGHKGAALEACREGMKLEITAAQRQAMAGVARLLSH